MLNKKYLYKKPALNNILLALILGFIFLFLTHPVLAEIDYNQNFHGGPQLSNKDPRTLFVDIVLIAEYSIGVISVVLIIWTICLALIRRDIKKAKKLLITTIIILNLFLIIFLAGHMVYTPFCRADYDPSIIRDKVIITSIYSIGIVFILLIFYSIFNLIFYRSVEAKNRRARKMLVISVIGLELIIMAFIIASMNIHPVCR